MIRANPRGIWQATKASLRGRFKRALASLQLPTIRATT
jgi:hypothetical protein